LAVPRSIAIFWEPSLKNREKGEAISYPSFFQSFVDHCWDRMTGLLAWKVVP